MSVTSLPESKPNIRLVKPLWGITVLLIGIHASIDPVYSLYMDRLNASNKRSEAIFLASKALDKLTSWENSKLHQTPHGIFLTLGIFKISYTSQTDSPTVGTTKINVIVTDSSKAEQDVIMTGYKQVAL